MKYSIYAVYDVKCEAYMTPFFIGSDAQAIRSFKDAIENPELPFGKHPEDFTLFQIGHFNDHDGEVVGNPPMTLGNALELRAARMKELSRQKKMMEINDASTIGDEPPV